MNRDGVRKPAWFAYKYLNELGPVALKDSDDQSWVTRDGDDIQALIFDFEQPQQDKSNRPTYTKDMPTHNVAPVRLDLSHVAPGRYIVTVFRTGYRANGAYSTYIDWGLPKDLNAEQIAKLQDETRDMPEKVATLLVGTDGKISYSVPLRANDIVLIKLDKLP
jgi:xylan 1,4-beta-xylosidase